MGNLEKALKFPFAEPGWGPKFALGAVFNIIGAALGFIPYIGVVFWLLFSFFPLGYAYKIFNHYLQGTEGPLPAWEKWEDLFLRGLFVFLITLGYGIIPMILYWLGLSLWNAGGFAAFIGVFSLILSMAVSLAAFFLYPMALALYAAGGESFAAAFRWNRIVEKIWIVQKEYLTGWLVSLAIFLALLFLRNQVLYLGWILYAVGFFYFCLTLSFLFGKICREGVRSES